MCTCWSRAQTNHAQSNHAKCYLSAHILLEHYDFVSHTVVILINITAPYTNIILILCMTRLLAHSVLFNLLAG